MDDEVIECLYCYPNERKRDYTLEIYTRVNDKCAEIASLLNTCCLLLGGVHSTEQDDDCSTTTVSTRSNTQRLWNRQRVGKVLWTAAMLCASTAQNEDEVELESNSMILPRPLVSVEQASSFGVVDASQNVTMRNGTKKREMTGGTNSPWEPAKRQRRHM